MRTTVNLDDDVLATINQLRQGRSLGLSEAVNALIRDGLRAKRKRPAFRQRSTAIGLSVDVSNVAETLEQLDGPSSR
jgi:Arc/MetJ family transcription regulator